MGKKSIFISYSHKDAKWKNKIITHLKVIESECNLYIWDDRKIAVGDEWYPEIEEQLNNASIAILLISASYLTSDFVNKKEIPVILKRRKEDGLVIIPFILKPCSWKKVPWLSKILVLPQDGRPLIKSKEYERENDLTYLTDVIYDNLYSTKRAKIYHLNNSTKVLTKESNDKIQRNYLNKSNNSVPRNDINQIAKGNKNIQVGGDFYNYEKPLKIKVLPPPESIGSDSLLKEHIQTLFNQIGEEREKRFGKQAYTVMYKNFKSDFKIKYNPWTIIWTWPKSCAEEIISYLEDRYNNTIKGRIEKAASRDNYINTRPQLFKKETELLELMGLKTSSPEVKSLLNKYFGVTSHTQLKHLQHWKFVKYLEELIKKNYD